AAGPLVSAPGANRNQALWLFIGLVVVLFVIQKAEGLAAGVAAWVRAGAGRPVGLASPLDVGWLGFSYVAFRLIHTLRDRQMGKLPALSFREYLTYLIFFPAYTAGPIDRAERFVRDYRALPALPPLDAARAVEGGGRIAAGLVKKFVVADALAAFALNAALAGQARGPLDLWIALYAFAFRLYFDFSGYSDIAIGIARLYGVNLPENFNLPYLRSNITQFWNSWHMTLSTWARLYVFTPLSRALMARKPKPSPLLVILLAQMATMLVIGLWHGITLNFVMWGVWHALGLWLHKVYSDRTRDFYQGLMDRPALRHAVYVAGVLATFHFVALGWVWFALPGTDQAIRVLLGLFGLRGAL
ncbi:MAG: MBOAT family protein, partial [Anaerolineae bacterium]|nr:MBOAT family protein [Anaerolineae bacterium]